MALKTTDSGVLFSQGRGAGAVRLSLDFKAIEKWAKRCGQGGPKLMDRSFARAARTLKTRFSKIMASAGGVNGVSKFRAWDEFTRARYASRTSTQIGGILSEKNRHIIYKDKSSGVWHIGWPDALAEAAVRFQDCPATAQAAAQLNDNKWRHWMHKRGIHDIPRVYTSNPRPVVAPFQAHVDEHLDKWARSIYLKDLARMMLKERGMIRGKGTRA